MVMIKTQLGDNALMPPKLILFVLSSKKKEKKEVLVRVLFSSPMGFRLFKAGTEFLDSFFNTLRC